jgi:hypothetical protein
LGSSPAHSINVLTAASASSFEGLFLISLILFL